MISKKFKVSVYSLISILSCSCEGFLKVDAPKNEIVSETVFVDEKSITSAIVGIYSEMMTYSSFVNAGGNGISNVFGLSADELQQPNPSEFQRNRIQTINPVLQSHFWQASFKYLWYTNSVIEGIAKSNLTQSVKNRLEGEAKFIRAFSNFYLVNIFGAIPLVTNTDYRVNSVISRTNPAEVYAFIIEDLLDAQAKLSEGYITAGRTRPNKAAADALLARVYLYNQTWEPASTLASSLINNTNYHLEPDLDRTFLANSAEAIWQLMPVMPGRNTNEGEYFIQTGSFGNVSVTTDLIDSFEDDDHRKTAWLMSSNNVITTLQYPFKYKIGQSGQTLNEFLMVFRLAEMYLIRAEARAHLDDLSGALADINILRVRAALTPLDLTTKDEVLDAIYQERRIELFVEWGHRWFDLKRTGQINEVLSAVKADWQPSAALFPIPQSEIERNPNLLPQNPGY